jgi:hypothetical protein
VLVDHGTIEANSVRQNHMVFTDGRWVPSLLMLLKYNADNISVHGSRKVRRFDRAIRPFIQANWIAMNNGMLCLVTHEYPLFTDARIVAEGVHGPYVFLNTVPIKEPGQVTKVC